MQRQIRMDRFDAAFIHQAAWEAFCQVAGLNKDSKRALGDPLDRLWHIMRPQIEGEEPFGGSFFADGWTIQALASYIEQAQKKDILTRLSIEDSSMVLLLSKHQFEELRTRDVSLKVDDVRARLLTCWQPLVEELIKNYPNNPTPEQQARAYELIHGIVEWTRYANERHRSPFGRFVA